MADNDFNIDVDPSLLSQLPPPAPTKEVIEDVKTELPSIGLNIPFDRFNEIFTPPGHTVNPFGGDPFGGLTGSGQRGTSLPDPVDLGQLGGGLIGAGVGAVVAPAMPIAGPALVGALGTEVATQIMERLGIKPQIDTLEQRMDRVSTETLFGAGVGKIFQTVARAGGIFTNLANRLDDTLNSDTNLTAAFTKDPDEFNKFMRIGATGSEAGTLDQSVKQLRAFLRTVKPSRKDKVFVEVEGKLQAALQKSGQALDETIAEIGKKSGNKPIRFGDLGFKRIINDVDSFVQQEAIAAAEKAGKKIPQELKVFLPDQVGNKYVSIATQERDNIAKKALKDLYPQYTETQKLVNRLERSQIKRTIEGEGIDDLAIGRLQNAKENLSVFEDIIDEFPLTVKELQTMRQSFDKLSKLEARSFTDPASRISAEANFTIANRFRDSLKGLAQQFGLKDALENQTAYFTLLKRWEPLFAERAALERSGQALISEVRESLVNRLFSPGFSPVTKLRLGLKDPFEGAQSLRAIELGNRIAGEGLEGIGRLGASPSGIALSQELGRETGFTESIPGAIEDVASFGAQIGELGLGAIKPAIPSTLKDLISFNLQTRTIGSPEEQNIYANRVLNEMQTGQIDITEFTKRMKALRNEGGKVLMEAPTTPLPVVGLPKDEPQESFEEVSKASNLLKRKELY